MIEKITVGLGERTYPIWIGDGILPSLGEALRAVAFPGKVMIVTNPIVRDLFAKDVMAVLEEAGYHPALVMVPDGEEHKTLKTLQAIYDALIEGGFDRSSGLIALGGGVVGDIAGFAAATFLRGIPFVQVPTTLLSQVDSSVGGKTAVNHPLGKNLIGAFYQPVHVHIDVSTLEHLPAREVSAGLAEVIKYGIISDRAFFDWLETHVDRLVARDAATLIEAVKRSCQIKANIVEIDEKETAMRAVLNFGHTFGHAVETLSGYGRVKHGEAVAIGMVVAATVSSHLGLCSVDEVARIRLLLKRLDLPVVPPPFDAERYLDVMARDKKVKDGVLRLVLNQGIGACEIRQVKDPKDLIVAALKDIVT